ncbi:hypothetical protein [Aeromonas veronii]|uniref:Uncharacterized protein n=1 Tax=Aeromonas veronii TaxID=654 RepID=A0AAW5MJR4_AERVE|nr:hypothetical protein [Aeromonas veronii]MCR4450680.1 hypothetical protein [Aeromonas veronii]
MKQKDMLVRHRRFLDTEAMTVKFRGLAPEMIQHMSRTDSETLSDWIKDAVRFRLRYDLKGDMSLSEFLSLQPVIPSKSIDANVDQSVIKALEELNTIAARVDGDMALVIRMLFQITHFMRAGLGDLVFSNPNLNTNAIDGQRVFEEGKRISHEFLKRARGEHVE